MTVRGTTAWNHAKLERHVINLDAGGVPLVCCWDECDRLAFECYKHVMCEHDARENCERADWRVYAAAGRTAHIDFVFCSVRHRAYYVNGTGRNAHESIARTGRAHGNLPVGMRNRDQFG